MTKAQAAALCVKWAEGEDRPCKHLHLELEHSSDDYLTDNYHCTACGELVAANTRAPFQVVCARAVYQPTSSGSPFLGSLARPHDDLVLVLFTQCCSGAGPSS